MAVERGLKDILEVICTTSVAQSLEAPGGTTVLHALVKNNQQGMQVNYVSKLCMNDELVYPQIVFNIFDLLIFILIYFCLLIENKL